MKLDRAIRMLAAGEPERLPFEREFAVAAFAAWLNAPDENMICEWMSLVTFNCIMASNSNQKHSLDAAWYLDMCEPRDYVRNLTDCLPSYSIYNEDYDSIYNNNRYASDIVRFLLTYNSDSLDKRRAASLRKAYYYINYLGGFVDWQFHNGCKYWLHSPSGHQVIWKRFKISAPFLFVKHHGRAINWRINPQDKNYVQNLINLANKREEIQAYFSKVAWIQQRMKSILDRRSIKSADYFKLPASLAPKEFQLPAMPAGANEIMETYTQADFI